MFPKWVPSAAFVLVLGLVQPALAEGWPSTFPAERVGSHLDGQPVIVVAAGDLPVERDAAASALEAAARASGKASLVMPGKSAGDLASLDDPAIVKRCASLPVKRVLVLRVFEGAPPTAVVALYDTQGTALGAFAATKGTAIDGRAETASQGVTASAARTVEAVTRNGGGDSPAQQQYDEEFLAMIDFAAMNQYGGYMGGWSQVTQGKYRKAVETRKFYELVERPDLVKRLDEHAEFQRNLWIGAGASLAGSVLTLVFALTTPIAGPKPEFTNCAGTADYDACAAARDARLDAWHAKGDPEGVFWAVSSAVLFTASLTIPMFALVGEPETMKPDEARRAIDTYNAKLRQKLGLPSMSDAAPARTSGPSLRLAVAPTGGGAMGLLRVTF